jgi:hypothetical protein
VNAVRGSDMALIRAWMNRNAVRASPDD